MRYLADTNVISELRNIHRANSQVRRWAQQTDIGDMAISAITLLELQYGARIVRKENARLSDELLRWVAEQVRPSYANRILAADEAVAMRCADLIHPRTRPLKDAIIAATALVHNLTVVTRNVADFEPMGIPLLNPWQA